MNTIASKQPRAAAKNFNLRAYLAGGAATVALIAGGVIVFGSLAAYVAFNGLPVGDTADGTQPSVAVEATGASAPANAAATLGAAPGAVAADPAAATAVAPPPAATTAGAGEGSAAEGTATVGTDTTAATTPGTSPSSGTEATGTGAPGDTAPAPSDGGSATSGSDAGTLGGAVEGVEDLAGGAGVDVPLSDATEGITGPVDQTVDQVTDGLGLGGTVDQVTDGLGLGGN